MIKLLIFTFLILTLVIISVLLFQSVTSARTSEGFVKFIGKKNSIVFLEVADSPEKKAQGLMNRPSLGPHRGMVFIFRPATQVTFWMKDTLISLDMIFINKGKIVKIVKGAIPNQTDILYPSDFPVTEVIEVNSGFTDTHMIKVGDRLVFENIAQIDYSKGSKSMMALK